MLFYYFSIKEVFFCDDFDETFLFVCLFRELIFETRSKRKRRRSFKSYNKSEFVFFRKIEFFSVNVAKLCGYIYFLKWCLFILFGLVFVNVLLYWIVGRRSCNCRSEKSGRSRGIHGCHLPRI